MAMEEGRLTLRERARDSSQKALLSSIKHCPFLSDLTKFSDKVMVHKIIPCNLSTYAKLNILLKEANNFATKQMF